MITFESTGNFKRTESFFDKLLKRDIFSTVDRLAKEGVAALAAATPHDSGLTAELWGYKIVKTPRNLSIIFTNQNVVDGVPIAVILQYGHGTGTGGYVDGVNYINPALKPVFDRITENVWKAVTSA